MQGYEEYFSCDYRRISYSDVTTLWASKNVSDGFLRTATDQSKAPVLVPDPTSHGLNNSDPATLVVDHTSDAVSHNKDKPPLLSTDNFVQPNAKLENKKISPSTYSDNPNTKSIMARSLARVSILGSLSLFSSFALRAGVQKSDSSISFGKSGNEPIMIAHGRLGYLSLSLFRQTSLWPLEMNSDPPPQHQLGWWCIHATIKSSSLEDYIGCKASTETDDDGVNMSWWDVYEVTKFSQLKKQGFPYPVASFTWSETPGPSLQRAKSLTSGGNKGAVLNVPANFTTLAGSRPREAESKALDNQEWAVRDLQELPGNV
ncbi:hypothetical protein Nepgr_032029 [Nepenthes gracilis]|uniref:Uncharacterized protein n=1 Tax=Nepenthes gracilis TaxID=150966 RepID=A0AAD3TJJ9_NEPGR|nr:hypothetical protein Nepgr_032029 [Nepenthes gracilis]